MDLVGLVRAVDGSTPQSKGEWERLMQDKIYEKGTHVSGRVIFFEMRKKVQGSYTNRLFADYLVGYSGVVRGIVGLWPQATTVHYHYR